MFKLYAVNNKHKSKVKGYWLDKDKVYKDNIHITEYKTLHALNTAITRLFLIGELSAFYTSGGKGHIVSKGGKVSILRHRRLYRRGKLSTSEVKGIVGKYGGATIHKRASGYIIEVYHN